MSMLKWLAVPLVLYLGLVALLYVAQRALMYHPDPRRTPPADAGLPQAEEVILTTADGERLIAWHVPPDDDGPVVLYFHGNGGALNLRADRFRRLVTDGVGLVALSYRGYGGSTGSPSETGLIIDAEAAYAFARERYAADRLVLWGESLGTGVAVAIGATHQVARIVLESPFTSTADVAAATYPFVPVRWLMKDQFRSDLRGGKMSAPVLVVHGARDRVVPIAQGERLYRMIEAPKRFLRLPEAAHNDHESHAEMAEVRRFIRDGLNLAD